MTATQTPAEKTALLYQTLAWLEAHPDKAIRGALAINAEGEGVRPQNPNAECFCFLGRLCVEAGPEAHLTTNGALREWLADLDASPTILSFVNDSYSDTETRFHHLRYMIDNITHRIKT